MLNKINGHYTDNHNFYFYICPIKPININKII